MPNALRERVPTLAGSAALACVLLLAIVLPQATQQTLQDHAFDLVLRADQALNPTKQAELPVIVIDIDRSSVDALGPWPWPRETLARLLEAVAAQRPKAIAIDILFDKPDDRSPAALARALGALTKRGEISALAATLPDGDKRFANALRGIPAVLGFVLDPSLRTAPAGAPIVSRGPLPFDDLWQAAGALGPAPQLTQAASGIAALPLPGSADGLIRSAPIFVVAAGRLLPGLAVDAVRVAGGASSLLIENDPPMLSIGDRSIALPRDGLLRLLPVAPERHRARALSAIDVIEGKAEAARIAGALILIGSSAPELGGLRETPTDSLVPSVQIQADAVEQILAGRAPRPLAGTILDRLLIILSVGVLAVVVGARLSPLVGAVIVLGTIAGLWLAAAVLSVWSARLLDPLSPSLAIALVLAVTAVTAASRTRWREALLRQRLAQHLAPGVVDRIVAEPGLLKLAGERREITALFTDIEGFVETTHRTEPSALISMLDRYFEGVAALVIEHGGMIDKIVGDGVHALFNAPIDLADHPGRAVACATAIRAWTGAYREAPETMLLGPTRIGIETGWAIVGDVGIRSKLDYTAHGDAVNLAARLQTANKQLGSTICIGPAAAARCDPALLRPLGLIGVAGRQELLAVFEPWPHDAPPDWRNGYLAADRMKDRDPVEAAALFDKLALERPSDPVPRLLAERIRQTSRQ